MPDESPVDPFLRQLCQGYTEAEVAEIEHYIAEWDASTYISVAQNILDHASRKEFDPLKYVRKATQRLKYYKLGAIALSEPGLIGVGAIASSGLSK